MKTILIADDDPLVLELIEEVLTGAGYAVITTTEPADLGALLDENQVDAIILDVVMPKVSGFDLLREVRSQERWRALPILLLSANTDSERRVRGFRGGADDFMAKPFDGYELLSRLERLVPRESASPALAGDLSGFSIPELLQNLQRNHQTGCLYLSELPAEALVEFADGGIVRASMGQLGSYDSLLALVASSGGRFRFRAEDVLSAGTEPMKIERLLLEAAWLEDELAKRRQWLPDENQELCPTGQSMSSVDEQLSELPLTDVLQRLESLSSVTMAALVAEEIAAPVRTRLALALLFEGGALVAGASPCSAAKAPVELTSLGRLIELAAARGFDRPIRLLILALPSAWRDVTDFLRRIPAELMPKERRKLLDQLTARGSGVVKLSSLDGVIMLSVQQVRLDRPFTESPLLRLAAGTMLWLGEESLKGEFEVILEGLQLSPSRPAGIIFDPRQRLQDAFAGTIQRFDRWRVLDSPPESVWQLEELFFGAD